MAPITEIILQALWIVLAVWFIYRAYIANKNARPISMKSPLDSHDFSKGFDDLFRAGGFITGIVMIILLVNKLITCGLICGTLFP